MCLKTPIVFVRDWLRPDDCGASVSCRLQIWKWSNSCLQIGNVSVGSKHKIALQTMTTSDTRDVEGTVAEVKRCADAGADLVRLTVQGKKEAEACFKIRERLYQVGNAHMHALW
jgi:hypothetical protein